MIVQEQIRKKVVPFGNGSIVYTPKDWIGREVIVTLPRYSLREEIFNILEPYLPCIQGIYLYGSYARGENEQNSDIDLLVVSNKDFKIKRERYEVTVISLEKLKENIRKNPVYMLVIKEAKALLNDHILEELKKIELNKKNLRWLLEDTESILDINREIIEMEQTDFNGVAYSLVLRLRLVYMIDCLLKNKVYTNKGFRKYAENIGVKSIKKLLDFYRKSRDNKKITEKIDKKSIEILWLAVKNEAEKKSKEIN